MADVLTFRHQGLRFHLKLKRTKDGSYGCKKCPFNDNALRNTSGLCNRAPEDCTNSDDTYYKIVKVG